MPIAEDHAGNAEGDEAHGADGRLEAALGVAESVAKLHGGEVRLRTRADDGGVLVELRFPLPQHEA
jgi:hypothetical protein